MSYRVELHGETITEHDTLEEAEVDLVSLRNPAAKITRCDHCYFHDGTEDNIVTLFIDRVAYTVCKDGRKKICDLIAAGRAHNGCFYSGRGYVADPQHVLAQKGS